MPEHQSAARTTRYRVVPYDRAAQASVDFLCATAAEDRGYLIKVQPNQYVWRRYPADGEALPENALTIDQAAEDAMRSMNPAPVTSDSSSDGNHGDNLGFATMNASVARTAHQGHEIRNTVPSLPVPASGDGGNPGIETIKSSFAHNVDEGEEIRELPSRIPCASHADLTLGSASTTPHQVVQKRRANRVVDDLANSDLPAVIPATAQDDQNDLAHDGVLLHPYMRPLQYRDNAHYYTDVMYCVEHKPELLDAKEKVLAEALLEKQRGDDEVRQHFAAQDARIATLTRERDRARGELAATRLRYVWAGRRLGQVMTKRAHGSKKGLQPPCTSASLPAVIACDNVPMWSTVRMSSWQTRQ